MIDPFKRKPVMIFLRQFRKISSAYPESLVRMADRFIQMT
jgi:hypothetical protein